MISLGSTQVIDRPSNSKLPKGDDSMTARFFIAFVLSLNVLVSAQEQAKPTQTNYEPGSIAERYHEAANRIIQATMDHNLAYERLEYLCTQIGHRITASVGMTKAINWAVATLSQDGNENVRPEPVKVDTWFRGAESASMTAPYARELTILGLGGSVPTTGKGVTARVLVVEHEDDFLWIQDEVPGKIILFNNKMPPYDPEKGSGYGDAVRFRTKGASLAASKGAAAVLVRSVTAKSLNTPHTGALRYDPHEPKIPAAAITVEDAELIARLARQGVGVAVNLKLNNRTSGEQTSANVIGELRGSTNPDEYVVIGGHLDSWDVGQGAHDDGGGCVIAIEAIRMLRKLDLIPRRTIRVVLWTNEEMGLAGARNYALFHQDEMPNHVAAIESDSGVFQPTGFSVEHKDKEKETLAVSQLEDIVRLLEPLGPMRIKAGSSGADVGPMRFAGFAMLGHDVEGSKYFDYHHTNADTIDKVDPVELSRNVAALATMAYVVADMPGRLGETEGKSTQTGSGTD